MKATSGTKVEQGGFIYICVIAKNRLCQDDITRLWSVQVFFWHQG